MFHGDDNSASDDDEVADGRRMIKVGEGQIHHSFIIHPSRVGVQGWMLYPPIFTTGSCPQLGSGLGPVVRVLDSGLKCRGFDPHTGHGLLLKLRQFHLPQFASVYSAANEYQHC